MEEVKVVQGEDKEREKHMSKMVMAIGCLIICVLALTFAVYGMSNQIRTANSERQMLYDRIMVLEQNINTLGALHFDHTNVVEDEMQEVLEELEPAN